MFFWIQAAVRENKNKNKIEKERCVHLPRLEKKFHLCSLINALLTMFNCIGQPKAWSKSTLDLRYSPGWLLKIFLSLLSYFINSLSHPNIHCNRTLFKYCILSFSGRINFVNFRNTHFIYNYFKINLSIIITYHV